MRRSLRRAFTLTELLVVIGIIIALVAILLPAVNKAYKNSLRTRMQADLAVVSQALDAYRSDFGDYPRPDSYLANGPYPGAVVLCWALVAPGPMSQDGYGDPNSTNPNPTLSGPGFRVRGTSGTVHPSYLNLDRFKLGRIDAGRNVTIPPNGQYSDTTTVILDRYNRPVLYYVANRAAPPGPSNYVGTSSPPYPNNTYRFNAFDNRNPTSDPTKGPTLAQLQAVLRMTGNPPTVTDPVTEPYLLLSAGPDGQFGTSDDATNLH